MENLYKLTFKDKKKWDKFRERELMFEGELKPEFVIVNEGHVHTKAKYDKDDKIIKSSLRHVDYAVDILSFETDIFNKNLVEAKFKDGKAIEEGDYWKFQIAGGTHKIITK